MEVRGSLGVQAVPQPQRIQEDIERAFDISDLSCLEFGGLHLIEAYDPCFIYFLFCCFLKGFGVCCYLNDLNEWVKINQN